MADSEDGVQVANMDDGFYHKILTHIHNQYTKGLQHDFTILTSGEPIRCHRLVLGAVFPFFQAMFEVQGLIGKGECSSSDLSFLNTDALKKLLTFAYTGMITYTTENIEPLVQAAGYLQVEEVTNECDKHLAGIITKQNAVRWFVFGRLYSLPLVISNSEKLILKHFQQMMTCSDFVQMHVEDILHFLQDDSLNIDSEDLVVDSVSSWIAHDVEARLPLCDKLLDCVRLDLCTTDFLKGLIDLPKYDHMSSMKFRNRIRNILRVRTGKGKRASQVKIHRPRYSFTTKKLVWVGSKASNGDGKMNHAMDCMFWKRVDQQWAKFTELPAHFSRCREWKVYAKNNVLFVTGGLNKDMESTTILGCTHSWMYYKGRWIELPEMNHGRWSHGVIAAKNRLFSFGGKSHRENTYTSHLKENEYLYLDHFTGCVTGFPPMYWIPTTSMKFKFYDPLLLTDAEEDNIYLLGMVGCPSARFVRKTYAYNICRRGFTACASMPKDAPGAAVARIGRDMYVVGGEMKACLRYTPQEDTWCELTSPQNATSLSTVVVLDDRIVLGCKYGRTEMPTEQYDWSTDSWGVCDVKAPISSGFGLGALFNVEMNL